MPYKYAVEYCWNSFPEPSGVKTIEVIAGKQKY
jgi:hypothetical protein